MRWIVSTLARSPCLSNGSTLLANNGMSQKCHSPRRPSNVKHKTKPTQRCNVTAASETSSAMHCLSEPRQLQAQYNVDALTQHRANSRRGTVHLNASRRKNLGFGHLLLGFGAVRSGFWPTAPRLRPTDCVFDFAQLHHGFGHLRSGFATLPLGFGHLPLGSGQLCFGDGL